MLKFENMADEFKKGYKKGYEEGLREGIDEVIALITRGYKPQEIKMMLKSKIVSLDEKIQAKVGTIEPENEPTEHEILRHEEFTLGSTYLIRESRFEKSIDVFLTLSKDRKGLCITRINPMTQDRLINSSNIELYWLTAADRSPKSKYGFISPTDLVTLASTISSFVKHKKNKNGIVLLQGVEYLISQTSFNSVLKMVQRVNDYIVLTKSILLLSANPAGIDKMDYSNLLKEMTHEI
jgi:hypothetical protein